MDTNEFKSHHSLLPLGNERDELNFHLLMGGKNAIAPTSLQTSLPEVEFVGSNGLLPVTLKEDANLAYNATQTVIPGRDFITGEVIDNSLIGTDINQHILAKEIVFVDSYIDNYQHLIASIKPSAEIIILNRENDNIKQISNVLAQRSEIAAIHIISHGSSGSLQLNPTDLNLDNLNKHSQQIQQWANALTKDADILLYGCNVASGEKGLAFVDRLSELTDADIAASNNITGNISLNGDWILEENTGEIETQFLFNKGAITSYAYTLDTSLSSEQINEIVDELVGSGGLFDSIQNQISNQVTNQRLPIVGTKLNTVTQFFDTSFISNLKAQLEVIKNSATPTVQAVKQILFNAFGVNGTNGLLVLDPNADKDGILDTVADFNDIKLVLTDANNFTFDLQLKKDLTYTSVPLPLDLGLPALIFNSTGLGLDAKVGYEFGLKFGLDNGIFSFDTSAKDEFKLNLNVGLKDNLSAEANLGLLNFAVKEAADNPLQFGGAILVDLQKTNGELTATPTLSAGLENKTNISLDLLTKFGTDDKFPSIEAKLDIGWDAKADLTLENFDVKFRDVKINAGSFISDFIRPIGEQFDKVFKPLQPVIDILDAKIPGTNLGIIELLGDKAAPIKSFINTYKQLSKFKTIASSGEFVMIDNLDLSKYISGDLFDLNEDKLKSADLSSIPFVSKALPSEFTELQKIGVNLPILTDPSEVFKLLIGNESATLFEFDMAPVGFKVPLPDISIPVLPVPPIGIKFAGDFSFNAKFGFGYDAKGLHRTLRKIGTPFDGFYLKDTSGLGLGLEIRGSGQLGVDNEFVSAALGVGLSLNSDIKATLKDDIEPDHRLRTYEIEKKLQKSPLCLFELNGQMKLGIFGEGTVGIGPFKKTTRKTFFDKVLVDFSLDCGDSQGSKPMLANLDNGVLRLNMGRYADQRGIVNNTDGNETFKVEHIDGEAVNETVKVSAFGLTEEFTGISKIYAEGGAGDDVIELAPGVLAESELWGDFNPENGVATGPDGKARPDGKDRLFAGKGLAKLYGGGDDDYLTAEDFTAKDAPNLTRTGSAYLYGGDGNDEIAGGSSDDFIYGGAGEDALYGNDGRDLVYGERPNATADISDIPANQAGDLISGGKGDDSLYGEVGNDIIEGLSGNDNIDGAEGDDAITGGAGRDLILGGKGKDLILGEAENVPLGQGGNDTIYAGADDDTIEDDEGDDILDGEAGFDSIKGGIGNDSIAGGDANDTLEGGADNDTVFGGLNDDILRGQEGEDYLEGGDENDQIFAGAGNDQIIGGNSFASSNNGDDTIYGEDGNDRILGDNGNVETLTLISSAGNDKIFSGNGNDLVYSQGGDDYVEGSIGFDTIFGGLGNDSLLGQEDDDYIEGGADNDTVFGGLNDDILRGQEGEDYLEGGDENDQIFAGAGNDQIIGGNSFASSNNGDDTIYGEDGNDRILGDNGNVETLTLISSAGNDKIFSGNGNDLVYSQGGDDYVEGNIGLDTIFGGLGNDSLLGQEDADYIEGGADSDRISSGAADDLVIGGSSNLDDLEDKSDGADEIIGDVGNDIILGDNGTINPVTRDVITNPNGGAGSDTIYGGVGNEIIFGGGLNDYLVGDAENGSGKDIVVGDQGSLNANYIVAEHSPVDNSGGNDTISGSGGEDFLLGGDGNDSIAGDADPDVLVGDNGKLTLNQGVVTRTETTNPENGGNDTITGSNGADLLLGGSEDDNLSGGSDESADILLGDNGVVVINDASEDANDIFSIFPTAGGKDTIDGGAGNDIAIGGTAEDLLLGFTGADILLGDHGRITRDNTDSVQRVATTFEDNGGDDSIDGNEGADIALGGQGNDSITGGNADDILLGDNGVVVRNDGSADANDIYSTSPTAGGSDTITGDEGADIVVGGRVGDRIFGNQDNDILLGDGGRITRNANDVVEKIETTFPDNGGDDTVEGNQGKDIILGGYANDRLTGNTEADIILGDNGVLNYVVDNNPATLDLVTTTNPTLGGNDIIDGNEGDDIAFGGSAADIINGGDGKDLVFGDHGKVDFSLPANQNFTSIDTSITDKGGNDIIHGNADDDIILGGQADDLIFGDGGDDDIIGGHNVAGGTDGNDSIDGGTENDVITGDNAIITRRVDNISPRMRVLAGETIYDDAGNPLITANSQANPTTKTERNIQLLDHSVNADAKTFGNDAIAGGANNDMIFGQLGNDVIQGDSSISEVVSLTDPSVENSNDGDDYIEGNGGNDLIFGNLGQDDIIGDSSSLFGNDTQAKRPTGQDTIFGGAGTQIDRNNLGDQSAEGHARDADAIVGDNGNIFRLVGTKGNYSGKFLNFTYDNYSKSLQIIPRAIQLLDYTSGGNSNNLGGDDLILGEAGDDVLYGMTGNDVMFGNAQDDDIFGGTGHDRIYGGTGEDGILGDDGRIITSRNGETETLYGITVPDQEGKIGLPGPFIGAIVNEKARLKKEARWLAFESGGNDVIYGGLGDDFLHGGAGDDGISGAEALPEFYNMLAVKDFNTLRYDPLTRKLAAYDAVNPRLKINNFFLNFEATNAKGEKVDDGKDYIFGDFGNDWLVGGTRNDRMFGGMGDDLLNADDNHDTNNGLNNRPDDPEFADGDFAFGGGGLDVMIANTGRDRLFDWTGEFNSFIVPFSPFGQPTIVRSISPHVVDFLLALGEGSGADQNLSEPYGELGLVTQKDPQWKDQHGAPRDPQPGNIPGVQRDTQGQPEWQSSQGGSNSSQPPQAGSSNGQGNGNANLAPEVDDRNNQGNGNTNLPPQLDNSKNQGNGNTNPEPEVDDDNNQGNGNANLPPQVDNSQNQGNGNTNPKTEVDDRDNQGNGNTNPKTEVDDRDNQGNGNTNPKIEVDDRNNQGNGNANLPPQVDNSQNQGNTNP
ncbi:DUF4347 domain-containing protein, partial [Microcoleus sp. Pol17C6]|uniref:DUF4347 domain-containing protein n=1 Tax=Microcoleus sp. Pol17C6 TaxID=3055404 RepID=UPI002FD5FE3F